MTVREGIEAIDEYFAESRKNAFARIGNPYKKRNIEYSYEIEDDVEIEEEVDEEVEDEPDEVDDSATEYEPVEKTAVNYDEEYNFE